MSLRVLSLGAGVQSSAIAFMMVKGKIKPADFAVFSDTGAEPKHVYDYLDWLEPQLPFPVRRVMHKEGLLENLKSSIAGGRLAGAPFFTKNPDGTVGMLRRQCTSEFKLNPILQGIRRELGLKKGERYKGDPVTSVIGISFDEKQRMTTPMTKWLRNSYPLVESRITRQGCIDWLEKEGVERMPRKSACTFCPYHDNKRWLEIKETEPDSWAQSVEVDELIRTGIRGTKQPIYVHRSCTPLTELDLVSLAAAQDEREKQAKRQGVFPWWKDMNEECEGICGL